MTKLTIKKIRYLFSSKISSGVINKMSDNSSSKFSKDNRLPKNLVNTIASTMLGSMCLLSAAVSHASPAYIIMDNTAGLNNTAIMSNMSTERTPICSKSDVLQNNAKNCFSLGSNDVQVVQNDGSGNLVSMIGVSNSDSTNYENKGTAEQTYHFTAGQHLFNIDKFRTVANNISLIDNSGIANTYGSISFEQFLNNIKDGKTMHGIVRVKIPLVLDDQTTTTTTTSTGSRYRMCNETRTTTCNKCGPGPDTVLKAGETYCDDITLPANAQININGALMFDWVNCQDDTAIQINELPENSENFTFGFGISIPLNINPANVDNATQTMAAISEIQSITGSNQCSSGNSCNVSISAAINYSLVSQESRDMYQFKIGSPLTSEVFSTLSKSDQYHLLFPSGYANGWANAFSALGISSTTWNSWGLSVEGDSGNVISANSVRRESFSDIPALMYTGGLNSIKHHTNISGLIYAAQAIEINQAGISNTSISVSDTNYTNFQQLIPQPEQTTFTPSYQYINGSIIVRDGFYFEATQSGGITLVSNNPDSYSNTEVNNGTGNVGFKSYTPPTDSADSVTPGSDGSDESVLTNNRLASNGPQWVEIRPK